MYIRFETNLIHPNNGKFSGIIQAVSYLEVCWFSGNWKISKLAK
jgi:hypothetical protein